MQLFHLIALSNFSSIRQFLNEITSTHTIFIAMFGLKNFSESKIFTCVGVRFSSNFSLLIVTKSHFHSRFEVKIVIKSWVKARNFGVRMNLMLKIRCTVSQKCRVWKLLWKLSSFGVFIGFVWSVPLAKDSGVISLREYTKELKFPPPLTRFFTFSPSRAVKCSKISPTADYFWQTIEAEAHISPIFSLIVSDRISSKRSV